MLEILWQQFVTQLITWPDQVRPLLDPNQLLTLIIVLAMAWLLQFPLRRLLESIEQRLTQLPWTTKLMAVIEAIALPLSARVLGQLAVEIFRSGDLDRSILVLANRLITLWFIYRLLQALLSANLTSARSRFWTQKVLLPSMLLLALLRVVGLLERVLQWGINLGTVQINITIGSIIFAVATAIVFFALSRGLRQFLNHVFLPRAGVEPALTNTISTLVSYAIIIIGIVVALQAIGIDLTTLTVIAGGLSVGLAFGLQEIVNNFVSGFILLFERSLGPGDVVRIEDDVGQVQTVGIRSATIKTRDNIELIVPNSYFLTEIVTNLTRSEHRVRTRISVGVSYEANPREVREALLAAAANHSRVLAEPAPAVHFKDFGDNSLNFDLLVWTDDAGRIPGMSSDLRFEIWDALAARHIEIPFPQRDIHIRSGVPWSDLVQMIKDSALDGQ